MVVSSGIEAKMNAPVLRRLRKSPSTVGSVPTFRIVVFGQSGVGKTAMSVRFVTKRFIGEYDPTLENIYQHHYAVGGSCVLFEIMDTAGQEMNELMMEEKMRWADAFILVYAINDKTSFDEITRLKMTISHAMTRINNQHKQVQPAPVITIVGNKIDLNPDRMVSRQLGEDTANLLKCDLYEISVRDGLNDVIRVFEDTYEQYRCRMSAFHSISDSSGSSTRRKGKSFKFVDRIPRMQGKRRNYMFNDISSRSYVINDVGGDIMTSKIDEDRVVSENFPRNSSNGHYFHRSTASLPTDVTSSITSDQIQRRPSIRTRRNALIGMGIGSVPQVNGDATCTADASHPRHHKLLKASRHSDNSIQESYQDVSVRNMRRFDDNNNTDVSKSNRRCRSQENIGLTSHSMLENFTKTAVSFDVANGRSKRVS